MPDIAPDSPVAMVRETLDDLPDFPLPAPFHLRPYRPGDEEEWTRIHLLADKWSRITPELFQRQFGTAEKPLRERQLYLCAEDGSAVGTATAWWLDDYRGLAWGRVHWVAILPAFQGRGLSKPLLAAVMQRLRELGHTRAMLTTSAGRLPAIGLYLKFGFSPEPRSAAENATWRAIAPALGLEPSSFPDTTP